MDLTKMRRWSAIRRGVLVVVVLVVVGLATDPETGALAAMAALFVGLQERNAPASYTSRVMIVESLFFAAVVHLEQIEESFLLQVGELADPLATVQPSVEVAVAGADVLKPALVVQGNADGPAGCLSAIRFPGRLAIVQKRQNRLDFFRLTDRDVGKSLPTGPVVVDHHLGHFVGLGKHDHLSQRQRDLQIALELFARGGIAAA